MQNGRSSNDIAVNGTQESDANGEAETLAASDEETVVLDESEFTDNVGDVSVEINVDELVKRVESEQLDDVERKKEIRRRLEELAEERNLDDTYAIDLGED